MLARTSKPEMIAKKRSSSVSVDASLQNGSQEKYSPGCLSGVPRPLNTARAGNGNCQPHDLRGLPDPAAQTQGTPLSASELPRGPTLLQCRNVGRRTARARPPTTDALDRAAMAEQWFLTLKSLALLAMRVGCSEPSSSTHTEMSSTNGMAKTSIFTPFLIMACDVRSQSTKPWTKGRPTEA